MHEVESMFSGSAVTPWHKLGVVVDGQLSSADALERSGLAWRVRLEPLVIANPEWRQDSQRVPARAVVRDSDSKVLGAVGTRYTPVQNDELFAIGDALRENGARWETAGSLRGGQRVFALMRLDDEDKPREVVRGDELKTFLLLANAHDGSRAAEVYLTTTRVVCMNTFRMAVDGNDFGFRFRHTRTVADRVAMAGKALVAAREAEERFLEVAKGWAQFRMHSVAQLDLVCTALGLDLDSEKAHVKRRVEVARDLLAWERAHAAGEPDSLWTAVQAVTNYTSHADEAMRGRDSASGSDKRLDAVTWGRLAAMNRKAFSLAAGLTNALSRG